MIKHIFYLIRMHFLSIAMIILLITHQVVFSQPADSPWPMRGYDVAHTGQSLNRGPQLPTLIWKFKTGERISSSPAIDSEGMIYIGSYDKNLYAIQSDGTLKWKYETGDYIMSSPAIGNDGTVYVGSNDNHFYAIDSDGNLKWQYLANNRFSSSPVIDNNTIYVGSLDYGLYAFDTSGSLKWKYRTGSAVSSPAVGKDSTVYIGSADKHLYAIDKNGSLKWRFLTGDAVSSSPAIGVDNTVYVGSNDNYIYAIKTDGSLKWKYETGDNVYSSPSIGSDGTIYVGSSDQHIYAITSDGSLKWKYETGSYIESSPIVDSDGNVYVGSADYYIYAFNPDGSLKWRYLTGNSIKASPAIGSEGVLYIGSMDNHLYALGRKPGPGIDVSDTNLYFPETTSGQTKQMSFNIYNAGSVPLIGTISSNSTEFDADIQTFNIPLESTQRIMVSFSPSYDHYTSDSLLIASNDPDHPVLPVYCYGNMTVADTPWPMFGQNVRHTRRSAYAGPEHLELNWKYETGGEVYSSPSIGSDGTVYVGSEDNYIYAFSPDGSLVWQYETGDEVRCSPTIGSDGTIYVGSDDGYLYALYPNGLLKWKYPMGPDVIASPAIGLDGTVYSGAYVGLASHFYAIQPDGSLKWKYNTGDWNLSSPAIGSDGSIYFGSWSNFIYALNPDGSLKWQYQTGGNVDSSPAIGSDGTIYFGSDDKYLYALNPDGSFQWKYLTGYMISSSPAIGTDGTIYVGSDDQYLHAVNPNGSRKWRFNTGGVINSSPSIDINGNIYIGSYDRCLYVINPDGSVKNIYETDGGIESSPAIGPDRMVYIGSKDGHIYCFKHGTPIPKIEVSKELIYFGVVDTSNSRFEELTIENIGTDTLVIESIDRIDGSSDFYLESPTAFPVRIAPFSSIKFGFSFMPTSSGQKEATFEILNNDPDTPNVQVKFVGNLLRIYFYHHQDSGVNHLCYEKPNDSNIYEVVLNPGVSATFNGLILPFDIEGSYYGIHLYGAIDLPYFEFPTAHNVSIALTIGDNQIGDYIRLNSDNYTYSRSPYIFQSESKISAHAGDIVRIILMASVNNFHPVHIMWGGSVASYIDIPNHTEIADKISPSSISDLTIQTFTNESVKLIWTSTGDNGMDGNAANYNIRYQVIPLSSDTTNWWENAVQIPDVPIPSTSGVQDSVIVTGLSPDSTYYFGMKVGDDAGNWSELSNIVMRPGQTTDVTSVQELPKVFNLSQNYPNPFNPITNITFGIPNQQQSVRVQVFVYDLLGKLVKTLVNEEKTPGYYTVAWDGTNQIGNKVTSGLYVCRMEAGSYRNTRKMVLWK